MQEESPTDAQPDSARGDTQAEARLIRQIRAGNTDAGCRLVRLYYPGIYRYLLYLTESRELTEDLTQEVFLKAWRSLDRFDERWSLRPWLYRIAHREFLQSLRRQRPLAALETLGGVADPGPSDWTESVALRDSIRRLPAEAAEVVILHYLEGYTSEEISGIVGRPAGTIRYQLSEARLRLQQEWGAGDLTYLNERLAAIRQWAWLPLDRMYALEARVRSDRQRGGVTGEAGPPRAGESEASEAGQEREKDTIDRRLTRKVTLAVKAIALGALCERLRADTAIDLSADASVADGKVTLFCHRQSLRDVMRQLSRAFGYSWRRSSRGGAYRYHLGQELAYQLLEEELRTRDHNAALLNLEREIERFRPSLDLSPEAAARAQAVSDPGKQYLGTMAGYGWGAIQMWFRLTPQQHADLRTGGALHFSEEPRLGEQPLPPEVARGVLQSLRDVYFYRVPDGFGIATGIKEPSLDHLPLTTVPEARASVSLYLQEIEPGRVALLYDAGSFSQSDLPGNSGGSWRQDDGILAVGTSPVVAKPDNRAANARLAAEPALQHRLSVRPEGHDPAPTAAVPGQGSGTSPDIPAAGGPSDNPLDPPVTTADVLEALHQATGLPIISDFYTHLYAVDSLTVADEAMIDGLNRLADAMQLRWSKDEGWLQFRSANFHYDRTKEVATRFLSRWAASRQLQGILTLDELVEIAQLPDAQLDATEMARGSRACWGLTEWDLARSRVLRPHLRFLAELTRAQRREAMSPAGIQFLKLSLSQQQCYLTLALQFDDRPLQGLDELMGATLRVEYTRPGEFAWVPRASNLHRWVVPMAPGPGGRRALVPTLKAPTRDAVLAAARRLDPDLLEALLAEALRLRPAIMGVDPVAEAGEIVPTGLNLWIVYIPGLSNRRNIVVVDRQSIANLSSR